MPVPAVIAAAVAEAVTAVRVDTAAVTAPAISLHAEAAEVAAVTVLQAATVPTLPAEAVVAGADEAVLPVVHLHPAEAAAEVTASAATAVTEDTSDISRELFPILRRTAVLLREAEAVVLTAAPRSVRHPAATVL